MNEPSPTSPTLDDLGTLPRARQVELPSMLLFAQLGLRLIGVLLFLHGVSVIVGGVFLWVVHMRAMAALGDEALFDLSTLYGSIIGFPHLAFGLYLILDGRWVLNNVFASTGRGSHRLNDEPNDSEGI